MNETPKRRPWILMTAEAASGRRDVLPNITEEYDLIIVPAQYMQRTIELLDAPQTDGQ